MVPIKIKEEAKPWLGITLEPLHQDQSLKKKKKKKKKGPKFSRNINRFA